MKIESITWPNHPKIYEINTWPWLHTLSEIYNREITLTNIPEEIFEQELSQFNAIWLMGVWERSPQGRDIAIQHPDLQEEYRKALRYFSTDDVVGSPYAVHYYHVDSHLGGKEGLVVFRKKLANRGSLLLLDYVPNHVAVDHLWTLEKSDLFIKGTLEELMTRPNDFFSVGGQIYANGKDPYFPSWTDSAQINAFSSEARQKAINTLLNIAEQCDGVRCDMAMLMTNRVFSQTWGERAGTIPEKEFWVEVIQAVREKFSNFKFLAEVYWNMEWELQQEGFDFCYDKTLYDRMIHDNAQAIRTHLQAEWDYQRKLVRFIENHDEKRALEVFGKEKSRTAAIIALTLPGARLIHEGQMRGYKIKLPVQLGRRIIEEDNSNLMDFYKRLLIAIPGKEFSNGTWSLCGVEPITGDKSSIISYQWWTNERRQLTVVNFSQDPAQGHVRIDGIDFGTNEWIFTDLLTQEVYKYKGDDLNTYGLYIELSPWSGHIFDIKRLTS